MREITQVRQASLAAVLIAVLVGCAQFEVYLRPERTSYLAQPLDPKEQSIHLLPLRDDRDIPFGIVVTCLDRNGEIASSGTKTFEGNSAQCLYYSIEAKQLADSFARLPRHSTGSARGEATAEALRNAYLSYLLNVSDQNCSTFLNRAFANKASFDTGKSVFQDVVTGATAAIANASPHTSAGLGLTNLVLGKSVDNVNATFYFDKTFQAMAAAIDVERKMHCGWPGCSAQRKRAMPMEGLSTSRHAVPPCL
jgi:hypothetical protein